MIIKENLWFIMPRQGTYRYALLINTCQKPDVQLTLSAQQSIHSHFQTLSLNRTSEVICLKVSDKIDHNWGSPFKSHFYELLKNSEILRVISPFKHKFHNWGFTKLFLVCFINLNHQSLDVSMVITSVIIILQHVSKSLVQSFSNYLKTCS